MSGLFPSGFLTKVFWSSFFFGVFVAIVFSCAPRVEEEIASDIESYGIAGNYEQMCVSAPQPWSRDWQTVYEVLRPRGVNGEPSELAVRIWGIRRNSPIIGRNYRMAPGTVPQFGSYLSPLYRNHSGSMALWCTPGIDPRDPNACKVFRRGGGYYEGQTSNIDGRNYGQRQTTQNTVATAVGEATRLTITQAAGYSTPVITHYRSRYFGGDLHVLCNGTRGQVQHLMPTTVFPAAQPIVAIPGVEPNPFGTQLSGQYIDPNANLITTTPTIVNGQQQQVLANASPMPNIAQPATIGGQAYYPIVKCESKGIHWRGHHYRLTVQYPQPIQNPSMTYGLYRHDPGSKRMVALTDALWSINTGDAENNWLPGISGNQTAPASQVSNDRMLVTLDVYRHGFDDDCININSMFGDSYRLRPQDPSKLHPLFYAKPVSPRGASIGYGSPDPGYGTGVIDNSGSVNY